MARKYAVIDRLVSYNKFNHLNKPYYADKALVHMHSSFKIVLERANFIAGEVVRGAVIFDLEKDAHDIQHIRIGAQGIEASHWTEGSGKSSATYRDSRNIFGRQIFDGVSLSAGTHVYPFEFQLPAQLVSSVSYYGGDIVYLIFADVISLENSSILKYANAFFNVYGPETRFKSPLRVRGLFRTRKVLRAAVSLSYNLIQHFKQNWAGNVTLSSGTQYPNKQYVISIDYHNVDRVAVKEIKVSMRTILILRRLNTKYEHSRDFSWPLLADLVPMHDTTDEHVRYDYRYVMPPAPPTVAPIDGAKLFELHTIVKISVALVDSTVRRKVMPIAVGVVVTEDFAREPHVVDPNASAALKVYKAKVPVDHSLVAYKTRSVHFYNEKIFSSYQPADLIKIENVFVRDEGNNTNVRRQDG